MADDADGRPARIITPSQSSNGIDSGSLQDLSRQILASNDGREQMDSADEDAIAGTTGWLTRRGMEPDEAACGLPPVLLFLSPDAGRCEVSVLDLAAWSSTNPSWPGCRGRGCPTPLAGLGFPRDSCGPAAEAQAETSRSGATAQPLRASGQGRAGIWGDNDSDGDGDGDTNGEVAGAGAAPLRRSSTPSLVATGSAAASAALGSASSVRPKLRSVTVARVGGARGSGPYYLSDSPAGSSSGTAGRSCLRPSRTWPAEAASQGAELARPIKTVRWLDHVALQALEEARSAVQSVHGEPLLSLPPAEPPIAAVQAAEATPQPGPAAAAAPISPAELMDRSSILYGTPGCPMQRRPSPSPPRLPSPSPSGCGSLPGLQTPTQHSAPAGTAAASPTHVESVMDPTPPTCTDGGSPEPPPTQLQSEKQQLEERQQEERQQEERQQFQVQRFLSPQMLSALERSQPISEVHTFARSDSSDQSIVLVQPPYGICAGVAAVSAGYTPAPYGISCRMAFDWLSGDPPFLGPHHHHHHHHHHQRLADDGDGLVAMFPIYCDSDGDLCTDLDDEAPCWGVAQQQQQQPPEEDEMEVKLQEEGEQWQRHDGLGPTGSQAPAFDSSAAAPLCRGAGGVPLAVGAAGDGGGGRAGFVTCGRLGDDVCVSATATTSACASTLRIHSSTASFGFNASALLSSDIDRQPCGADGGGGNGGGGGGGRAHRRLSGELAIGGPGCRAGGGTGTWTSRPLAVRSGTEHAQGTCTLYDSLLAAAGGGDAGGARDVSATRLCDLDCDAPYTAGAPGDGRALLPPHLSFPKPPLAASSSSPSSPLPPPPQRGGSGPSLEQPPRGCHSSAPEPCAGSGSGSGLQQLIGSAAVSVGAEEAGVAAWASSRPPSIHQASAMDAFVAAGQGAGAVAAAGRAEGDGRTRRRRLMALLSTFWSLTSCVGSRAGATA